MEAEKIRKSLCKLRQIRKMNWSQIGQMFGVPGHQARLWASGKPMPEKHVGQLWKFLDEVKDTEHPDLGELSQETRESRRPLRIEDITFAKHSKIHKDPCDID